MGIIQLMFVFLSFVLFDYFVLISGQQTKVMLEQEAQKEMFDCMLDIGDLANHYAVIKSEESGNPITYSGFESPGYLINRPYCNISYDIIGDSVIIFTGNTIYDSTSYERICTPSNSMAIIQ